MSTATFKIWRGDSKTGAFREYTTEVAEGTVVRRNEIRHLLRRGRLRIRVVGRAEHRDEELDLDVLARLRIYVRRSHSRVVHEALLTGLVDLPHRHAGARACGTNLMDSLPVAI